MVGGMRGARRGKLPGGADERAGGSGGVYKWGAAVGKYGGGSKEFGGDQVHGQGESVKQGYLESALFYAGMLLAGVAMVLLYRACMVLR